MNLTSFDANHKFLRYTGRFDLSDPKKLRTWASGAYLTLQFQGTSIELSVRDELLYGKSHNYVAVSIDREPTRRIKLTDMVNTLRFENLPDGAHTLTLAKDTEAGIGWIEFLGGSCERLLPPPRAPRRKLEFFGDSITTGTGSDTSVEPCGKGEWYDQHNAFESYGPRTARALNAQWQITAVAGIGLVHSCCNMKINLPQVFDKVRPQLDAPQWDFKRYQPDALTVCLGQNDGTQDPAQFAEAYVSFLERLRSAYPKTYLVCLTSPMADPTLRRFQKEQLPRVVEARQKIGDRRVTHFAFSRSFNGGCGGHPDLAQHAQIAEELTAFLKATLRW